MRRSLCSQPVAYVFYNRLCHEPTRFRLRIPVVRMYTEGDENESVPAAVAQSKIAHQKNSVVSRIFACHAVVSLHSLPVS